MSIKGDCSTFGIELFFDNEKAVWFWTVKVFGMPFNPIVSTPFIERRNAVVDITDFVHNHFTLAREVSPGKVFDI